MSAAEDYALGLAQERQEMAHDAAQVEQGAPLLYSACSCTDSHHHESSIAEWVATRYAADSDVLALANVDRAAHITSRSEAEALAADVAEVPTQRRPKRYDQCDATCTADCGHCKGQGKPEPHGTVTEFATCMCVDLKHRDGDHLHFETGRELAAAEQRYYPEGSTHLIQQVTVVTAVAA